MSVRVLHVLPCLARGGTESFVMNSYRAIDQSRCTFDFALFSEAWDAYRDEITMRGGSIYCVGTPARGNIRRFTREMLSVLREHGPYDVVHSHANIQGGWVMRAARLGGVRRRIAHAHGASGAIDDAPSVSAALYRTLERHVLLSNATQLVACSADAGAFQFGSAFGRSGVVVPNGIDVDAFASCPHGAGLALREAWGIPADAVVMGSVSRFEEEKNPLFTLEVFRAFHETSPASFLVMGGSDGGMLDTVKGAAASWGIADAVRFIGVRRDMPACLRAFDVYLMPSKCEGFGIALLEAQASGCLCFASRGVPSAADMGIGTLRFLNLDDGASIWAQSIMRELDDGRKRPAPEFVRQRFASKGFDVVSTCDMLMRLYGADEGGLGRRARMRGAL